MFEARRDARPSNRSSKILGCMRQIYYKKTAISTMERHVIEVPGLYNVNTGDEYCTVFSEPILTLRHQLESHNHPNGRWHDWLNTLKPVERHRKRKAMARLLKAARK